MENVETELRTKETVHKRDEGQKESKMSTFRRNLRDPLFKGKLIYTLGIYLTSISGGWIVAIKGPAFIDLQQMVGVGTSKGAAFFTAAGVGGVVGSLVGGAMYDRFNKYLVLFVSALLYGVTCALIPLCRVYWLMVLMFFLHEMSTGAVRSGSNVEIVNVWGAHAAKPFMQGLHFAFSLGAAMSPFSLEPFLSETSTQLNETAVNTTTMTTSQLSTTSTTPESSTESRIFWGFLIAAVFGAVCSLVYLIKYMTMRSSGVNSYQVNQPKDAAMMDMKHDSSVDKKEDALSDVEVQHSPRSAIPKIVIFGAVVLFFALYFFLDEVEDTTPSFMAIFVVKQFKLDKRYGTRVTAAFFAAYCAGRGVGMLIIGFITHLQLFFICSLSLLLGHTCLFLSGWFLWEWGLWVGVIIIGLAISVIFPASLTWTEKELTHLSGKLVGLVYIALYAGGLVNPQIIGVTMEMFSPMWYSYVLLTETGCFAIVFVVLVTYVRKVIHKYKRFPTQKQ